MAARDRSGSSPLRDVSTRDGPDLLVTSPSTRSIEGRLRRGSVSTVEAVKQRARRDTTTSSEVSSENELDPSVFKRRQINVPRTARNSNLLKGRDLEETKEEEKLDEETPLPQADPLDMIDEDSGEDSDGGSLSSDFGDTADSESLLDDVQETLGSLPNPPNRVAVNPSSPRKTRTGSSNELQALPPPRPISMIQPISALGQAIRARQSKPQNPVEAFAKLSGKGVPDPLNIRIYAPFSESPDKPFEMPLQRVAEDVKTGEKSPVTVADAIGLALYRYQEEGLKPPLPRPKLDVNRWTLRIVDDGEVEYDFPALSRTSVMTAFTSNNNRAATSGRGRTRGKAYDEFALVEATEAQFAENKRLTPKYTQDAEADEDITPSASNFGAISDGRDTPEIPAPTFTSTVDRPFASQLRKQSTALADKPGLPTVHSTPRMGPPKMLKIHYTSLEAYSQTNTIEVTTDTYIAEVLDMVCKRFNLDKAYHFLRVTGTTTVAPLDRTVESIGARTDLDLVRRRFVHEGGIGVGSPTSSSPNAPLLLTTEDPKKGKKGILAVHPLVQKQDLWGSTRNEKRYIVIRKQPMSFTPSHPRTLLLDGDYMHILPGDTSKTMFDTSAKTTTVPFSLIVGCKVNRRHPKTFRVIVFREREKKRYDFESQTANEAAEIVAEIHKGMEKFGVQQDAGY